VPIGGTRIVDVRDKSPGHCRHFCVRKEDIGPERLGLDAQIHARHQNLRAESPVESELCLGLLPGVPDEIADRHTRERHAGKRGDRHGQGSL
jgi:hypothetical protein